jgi:hypothetical protein
MYLYQKKNLLRYPAVEVMKRPIAIIVSFAYIQMLIVILQVIDHEGVNPVRKITLILDYLEMSPSLR